MNTVLYIILTLLVFTLIVSIHEWGHFIMARKNGIFVEEFAIGMGPAIFKHTTKKKMVFSIRLFPLGGFCRMKGEEAEQTEDGQLIYNKKDPDSFNAKSVGRRASVIAAGPIMNFILAFVLLLVVNACFGYTDPKVVSVEADYPAAKAGLEEGDRLYKLNGERIHVYDKVQFLLMNYQEGQTVDLAVKKPDGSIRDMKFQLKYDQKEERYRMGFTVASSGRLTDMMKDRGVWKGLGCWISSSFWALLFDIEITFRSIGMLLTGKVGMDALTGPIGMVSVVGQTYQAASAYGIGAVLGSFANLIILISANLGVLNLFPIPGLDGSQLVFLIIEKIRRKPMNVNIQNIIFLIGFILLFGLMIAVGINDVMNLVR